MFKKRPRAGRPLATAARRLGSKLEPRYWRERLFKNTFTYQNQRCEVNNWSVKIQHHGVRKTLSLRATGRSPAAREACQIYKAIVSRGWESVATQNGSRTATFAAPERTAFPGANSFDSADWTQRLIHRNYRDLSHPNGDHEFSVRIEHEGTNHYFPLATYDRGLAAQLARKIHRAVVRDGWEAAKERFRRELSVAFRWVENPIAWTYTTLHTRTADTPAKLAVADSLSVAVVESDTGIRRALVEAINKMPGFHSDATFDRGAQALKEMAPSIHLVLVSQSLADQPGTACVAALKAARPHVTGVLYSLGEDSDRLFASSPGGAVSYLFRRTPPNRILEPLVEARERGDLSPEEIANSVRHYFERTVATLSVGGSAGELTNLTDREQQVLALLSKGHPDKEIAELLRISTWTVHGHIKKIFEKLGVHNRTEAVVRFLHK